MARSLKKCFIKGQKMVEKKAKTRHNKQCYSLPYRTALLAHE